MFGLLSDLDDTKWFDVKEKPPVDKKMMDGGNKYQPWGLCGTTQMDDHIKYVLTSHSGAACQGVLFGARRNPLRDVGHCWMTFEAKKPGQVITGICIEDDWVKMKPEYLCTFGDYVPQKKELVRTETIDMGIYGDLVHCEWDNKGKPPRGKGRLGYHYHGVLRSEDRCGNKYEVYLTDEKGHSIRATITDTQRDPFHSITKGHFKICDGIIKGVMVEDSWVEMYK